MKIRNTVFLILLLLISMFIIGCQGTSQSPSITSPYPQGTDGLVIGIDESAGIIGSTGMFEIWEDETFPLDVKIENKGFFAVPARSVRMDLKGVAPADVRGVSFTETNSEDIHGVSLDINPYGDEETVHFGDIEYIGILDFIHDMNIFIDYEYEYESYVSVPQVCFKFDRRDNSVCDISGIKQSFISAGPISVGSVEQTTFGAHGIQLIIPISKNNPTDKLKADEFDEFKPSYDQVRFEITSSDNWICKSRGDSGVARLTGTNPGDQITTTEIRCTLDGVSEGDRFTREFRLRLQYFVKNSVAVAVRVNELTE